MQSKLSKPDTIIGRSSGAFSNTEVEQDEVGRDHNDDEGDKREACQLVQWADLGSYCCGRSLFQRGR